jgi:hypothetical protein
LEVFDISEASNFVGRPYTDAGLINLVPPLTQIRILDLGGDRKFSDNSIEVSKKRRKEKKGKNETQNNAGRLYGVEGSLCVNSGLQRIEELRTSGLLERPGGG